MIKHFKQAWVTYKTYNLNTVVFNQKKGQVALGLFFNELLIFFIYAMFEVFTLI